MKYIFYRYLKGLGIFQYHLKGGESNAFKGVLRSVRALEGAFGWRIGNGLSVSCAAAYASLEKDRRMVISAIGGGNWIWIWELRCPSKFKYFVWLCAHGCLATRELLVHRGISQDGNCVRCGVVAETLIHTLLDCSIVSEIWERCVAWSRWRRIRMSLGENWLMQLLSGTYSNETVPNSMWYILAIVCLWQVWKARNEILFQQQTLPVDAMVQRIKRMTQELCRAFPIKPALEIGVQANPTKWLRPGHTWYKLNTDASVTRSPYYYATRGGILSDDNGHWQSGFSRKLGNISINLAELLALRDGLGVVWHRRIPKLIAETDSKVIYLLIKSRETEDHPLHNILEDCRSFHICLGNSNFNIQRGRKMYALIT